MGFHFRCWQLTTHSCRASDQSVQQQIDFLNKHTTHVWTSVLKRVELSFFRTDKSAYLRQSSKLWYAPLIECHCHCRTVANKQCATNRMLKSSSAAHTYTNEHHFLPAFLRICGLSSFSHTSHRWPTTQTHIIAPHHLCRTVINFNSSSVVFTGKHLLFSL